MKAAVFNSPQRALEIQEWPVPQMGPQEILLAVEACGLCRTDLHILDQELIPPHLPLILGHQIVGHVVAVGSDVKTVKVGERRGVAWLARSCGTCSFCLSGRENLCLKREFTGFHRNGGFAEYHVALAEYSYPLPAAPKAAFLAPLLCAGLVGFRAYRMVEGAKTVGLWGFGASAHLLAQLALQDGKEVFAFTRPGDLKKQNFAKSLGVTWAGGSDEMPPKKLDGSILFAPDGALVIPALKSLERGGKIVFAEIHMSDLPSIPYSLLWEERTLQSVANLTREDALTFLPRAESLHVASTTYPLEKINQAIEDVRQSHFQGAAVILLK